MPILKYLKNNLTYLLIILISLISFFGAVIYRFYSLNNMGIALSLILAIIIFIILLLYLKSKSKNQYSYNFKSTQQPKQKNKLFYILSTFYFLLFTFSLYILFRAQTAESLISPWQAIPPYFFAFYGLATIILIIILLQSSNPNSQFQIPNSKIILVSLHYFLSFSIALIVYQIGYGFDPFIHQATVDLISKTGAVEPKPFYYLGQYSLILILHKITTLSIVWIDKLLMPLLAAIFLPAVLFRFLKKWFTNLKTNFLLIPTLLILPFSFFILTTPQNLAYLFLILTILYGLTCSNTAQLIIIYLFSLTTLAIHPLAGIPALLFALALTIYHSDKNKLKKYLYLLTYILSAITLPLAFYFVNKNNITAQAVHEPVAPDITAWFNMPNQENFILNFIYLYGFNLKIIISLLIIGGLLISFRFWKKCKIFFISFWISASLFIAYFLTTKLSFNFLIEYERENYTERILIVAIIFLLPFIITAFYWLLDRILKQPKAVSIPLFIFLAILITASLYISYPRFDRYHNSRGLSVSQNDIDAVRWIENQAEKNYIVLANQQVSAAALREFGFSRYYKIPLSRDAGVGEGLGVREIFYYPIPTSGQLYQYYLDMVYKKPSRETMLSAMDYAGVNEAYFVLNKYWWAFPKILAEAKLEADFVQEFDNNEIYVFKYLK